MADVVLRSRRLELRPLTASDAPGLHALWTAPGVRRYLWDDEIIAPQRTAAIVAESERLFERAGYGLWGARLRTSSALVGFGGYWYFHEPPSLELLYGVAERHWGEGLATELAAAVLDYGVARCGFREVHASTDVPNAGSIRVLEKLGFRREARATAQGLDTLFFRYVPQGGDAITEP